MKVGKPAGVALSATLLVSALGVSAAQATLDVPEDYRVLEPLNVITAVDSGRLDRRVAKAWGSSELGSAKGLAIDAFFSSPKPEAARAANVARMPASTTKLLTATAALKAFGPEHRFATSVVRKGGSVVLVGGGDPQLSSVRVKPGINANASLVTLAKRTAAQLRADGLTSVDLGFDDSLFGPPARPDFWKQDFLQVGVVAPITALMTDAGKLNPATYERSPDPALTAAQQFAKLLGEQGVQVAGTPVRTKARGKQVAHVESPPLANLVEHMLLVSDNTEADVLGHQVGLEVLGEPTFAGGATATLQVLGEVGIDTDGIVLKDGSGLARANRISPVQLVAVLRAAIETEPETLWPVYTGLPVAGFDGSLTYRFAEGVARGARGVVTGKTGTLTGTSSLAGLLVDRDQQLMLYAVMANDVSVWNASKAIDAVVAQAAQCGCRGPADSVG